MRNESRSKSGTKEQIQTNLPNPLLKRGQNINLGRSNQDKMKKLRQTPSFIPQKNPRNSSNYEAEELSQALYEKQLEEKTIHQLINQNSFLKQQLLQLKHFYKSAMNSHNNSEANIKLAKKVVQTNSEYESKKNKVLSHSKITDKNYQSQQDSFTILNKIGQNYQRVIKQLKNQYSDYEFMFSGDYRQKVDQQIQSTKEKIQLTKTDIKILKKELSKPNNAQQQLHEKYERQIYNIEVQLKEQKAKKQKKQIKITKIEQENRQKVKEKQSLQQYLDENDISWVQKQQNDNKKWEQLNQKKLKLIKIIGSRQKTFISRILAKQKQFQQLQNVSSQIQSNFAQINRLIEAKKSEIKSLQNRQKKKSKRTATQVSLMPVVNSSKSVADDSNFGAEKLYRRRIYTQLQSNNYFSSNKVLQRQKQWLDSICDSRFDNLEPVERNRKVGSYQQITIRRKIKLPAIQHAQLEASVVKSPILEYRSQTRVKPGQILHGNISNRQSEQIQRSGKSKNVWRQNSNPKYYSKNQQKHDQIRRLLNKDQLDLQEDYTIDDLLYD